MGKDEKEDKKVVYTKSLLQEVCGEEIGSQVFPIFESKVDPPVKGEREEDPEGAPEKGFSYLNFPTLAVENTEVEDEKKENDSEEDSPEKRGSDRFVAPQCIGQSEKWIIQDGI